MQLSMTPFSTFRIESDMDPVPLSKLFHIPNKFTSVHSASRIPAAPPLLAIITVSGSLSPEPEQDSRRPGDIRRVASVPFGKRLRQSSRRGSFEDQSDGCACRGIFLGPHAPFRRRRRSGEHAVNSTTSEERGDERHDSGARESRKQLVVASASITVILKCANRIRPPTAEESGLQTFSGFRSLAPHVLRGLWSEGKGQ